MNRRNQDDYPQQGNYGQNQNLAYRTQQDETYQDNLGDRRSNQSQQYGSLERNQQGGNYGSYYGGSLQSFYAGNMRNQSQQNRSGNQNYGSQGNNNSQGQNINQGRSYRLSNTNYGQGGGSNQGGNFPLSQHSYGQGTGNYSNMASRENYGSPYGSGTSENYKNRNEQSGYNSNYGNNYGPGNYNYEDRGNDEGFIERAGDTIRKGWNRAGEVVREGWNKVRNWGDDDRDENMYGSTYDNVSDERNYGLYNDSNYGNNYDRANRNPNNYGGDRNRSQQYGSNYGSSHRRSGWDSDRNEDRFDWNLRHGGTGNRSNWD